MLLQGNGNLQNWENERYSGTTTKITPRYFRKCVRYVNSSSNWLFVKTVKNLMETDF